MAHRNGSYDMYALSDTERLLSQFLTAIVCARAEFFLFFSVICMSMHVRKYSRVASVCLSFLFCLAK